MRPFNLDEEDKLFIRVRGGRVILFVDFRGMWSFIKIAAKKLTGLWS